MAYTVYALFDPREPSVVRYVGFSATINKRIDAHIAQARSSPRSTRKLRWIRGLLDDGVLPSWRELAIVDTVEQVIHAEIEQIRTHLESGHPLTNGTHGGDGATAWVNPETREHQRRMMQAWHAREDLAKKQNRIEKIRSAVTGVVYSDESKAKMREAKLGKPHARKRTAEWNAKISAAQKGIKRRPWTPEERERHMAAIRRRPNAKTETT